MSSLAGPKAFALFLFAFPPDGIAGSDISGRVSERRQQQKWRKDIKIKFTLCRAPELL